MSYYNDGRDVLEAVYPTCTSFVRYHDHPSAAGLKRRARGLVMVLSLGVPSAMERFRRVCYALENSVPWDSFSFDVYDHVGTGAVLPALAAHAEVRGDGELFWIRHGRVFAAMAGEFDPTSFDEFTTKLLAA